MLVHFSFLISILYLFIISNPNGIVVDMIHIKGAELDPNTPIG